ncbi:MAG TPA: NAD-dependent epimerase/dehydratase family protein [Roseiarcus sp.]|nr:NAD-dependent epimerase/dehydratase family protein [Roseiarcus sp.]
MNGRITIFGYGPVGKATAERLAAQGREITIAQRSKPEHLPEGAVFTASNALDPPSVLAAARDSAQIIVAIGMPYEGKLWRQAWPKAIGNFVAACEKTGARMVFIDNLYMYGPQTAPLVETMPLTSTGRKPAARFAATRVWTEAAAQGRARVAALRAPDFYGPDVPWAYLGDSTIGALAKGRPASWVGSPDIPHDYAYVPDVARAATTLIEAPDSAFGQAWHVPCAPTRTTRELLKIAADALGVPLRIRALPAPLLAPLGLFSPFLGEIREMRFQWDRPYRVDASKFAKAFWSDATPFEAGVRETALSFGMGAAPDPRVRAAPATRR